MKVINWEKIKTDNEFENDSILELYVGHTNFALKPKDSKILDDIEGIEVAKIPSKYKLVIGIGKCFDWEFVRKEIYKRFSKVRNPNKLNPEYTKKLNEKKKELNQKYDNWCLYLFQNGRYKVFSGTKEEIDNQVKFLNGCKKVSDGFILRSK